jgi:hypothetical protein
MNTGYRINNLTGRVEAYSLLAAGNSSGGSVSNSGNNNGNNSGGNGNRGNFNPGNNGGGNTRGNNTGGGGDRNSSGGNGGSNNSGLSGSLVNSRAITFMGLQNEECVAEIEPLPNCIVVEITGTGGTQRSIVAQCFVDAGTTGEGNIDLMTEEFAEVLVDKGIIAIECNKNNYMFSPLVKKIVRSIGTCECKMKVTDKDNDAEHSTQLTFAIYPFEVKGLFDIVIGRNTLRRFKELQGVWLAALNGEASVINNQNRNSRRDKRDESQTGISGNGTQCTGAVNSGTKTLIPVGKPQIQ